MARKRLFHLFRELLSPEEARRTGKMLVDRKIELRDVFGPEMGIWGDPKGWLDHTERLLARRLVSLHESETDEVLQALGLCRVLREKLVEFGFPAEEVFPHAVMLGKCLAEIPLLPHAGAATARYAVDAGRRREATALREAACRAGEKAEHEARRAGRPAREARSARLDAMQAAYRQAGRSLNRNKAVQYYSAWRRK